MVILRELAARRGWTTRRLWKERREVIITQALLAARTIIRSWRRTFIDSNTTRDVRGRPDLRTLDPRAKAEVRQFDAALEKIDAALHLFGIHKRRK